MIAEINNINLKITDLRKELQEVTKNHNYGGLFTEKVIECDAELIRAQRKLLKITEAIKHESH